MEFDSTKIKAAIDKSNFIISILDTLDENMLIEFYLLQKSLISIVNDKIDMYGTEARVLLCQQQDLVLNRLVKFEKSYQNDSIKNIYTPAVQGYRFWKNVELLKDKGLVGYYLAKEIKAKPLMMYCSGDIDYTFKNILPELELIYDDKNIDSKEQYNQFIVDNYEKMDCLILHGMYAETILFLYKYRQYRPDGKVFCGLDMNGYWLERIAWSSNEVKWFVSQCDIVATSSSKIRDILNGRSEVSFPCYYLPNGFNNLMGLKIEANAGIKKNVILTCGRIGTTQKNNLELLLGFAMVANELPDWNLRLVGTIVPEFQKVVNLFFESFPHLASRIIFTGAIYDKQLLYNEYAQAKCFALTSTLEGGTPNVYAEALNHGCMFIVSDIDSGEEMTNHGELGQVYKRNDTNELSKCILKMASKSKVEDFEEHIPKALKYANEHFNWENNTKKIAYMLNN